MLDFLIWWLMTVMIGMIFMPITGKLFARFKDGGWMFSKVLGIFVSGYVMWVLSSLHVLKFYSRNCWLVLAMCLAANVIVVVKTWKTKGYKNLSWDFGLIIKEEILE